MNIYLSSKNCPNENYTHVSDIFSFDKSVLNSEARSIICDCFLSEFSLSDIDSVIKKVFSKLRIGASITIIEKDIDLLCLKYTRNEITMEQLNDFIFTDKSTCSTFNIEFVEPKISDSIQIEEKFIDSEQGMFVIKGRRVK